MTLESELEEIKKKLYDLYVENSDIDNDSQILTVLSAYNLLDIAISGGSQPKEKEGTMYFPLLPVHQAKEEESGEFVSHPTHNEQAIDVCKVEDIRKWLDTREKERIRDIAVNAGNLSFNCAEVTILNRMKTALDIRDEMQKEGGD